MKDWLLALISAILAVALVVWTVFTVVLIIWSF